MAQRPFAVLDIDGTLLRWQLYHAVADELVKTGFLDKNDFKKVLDARMTWKKRKQTESFVDYEKTLVSFFDNALINIPSDVLFESSKKVISKYKDQVYSFTRDLIKELKAKDYLLFAISASEENIVKMLADYYEFDDSAGSRYGQDNGMFTGNNIISNYTQKPIILNELVAKHSATWEKSIGVGDSESDIDMLQKVERPIAFNPTKNLFETAKNNDWEVVIERKNMIYHLEPNNGQFILK